MHILRILFLLIASTLGAQETGFQGWTHLELGAGNYGPDGHTKASQCKTVLMKIQEVTDEKNYIDDLEEEGQGDYSPEEQYGVLFWTLDELVSRYGAAGVFHVNDLYAEYTDFATQKLIDYAACQGYDSVVIESISGDYQQIDAAKALSRYGRQRYLSVHLKNPEVSLYHDRIDGERFLCSERSRAEARQLLSDLAQLSESGLYLFILDHENFIPAEEKAEWMEKGIFYQETQDWEPVPYIFPEGDLFEEGKVFKITS